MGSRDEDALRFGIVCNGVDLQRWQLQCIEKLLALPRLAATVLLLPEGPQDAAAGGRGLFYRLWGTIPADSQRSRVALTPPLAALPAVRLVSPAEAAAAVQRYDLDFILSLSSTPSARYVLGQARYGVWAFSFGDWENYRGSPAGFWEIYDGASVTAALLVRLTEDPDVVVPLRCGYLRTKRASFRQNSENVMSRIAHWPAQVCADIGRGVVEGLTWPQMRSTAPWRSPPNTLAVLNLVRKCIRFVLVAGLRNMLQFDQWNVGIVREPIASFVGLGGRRPDVRWLPSRPRRETIADPFGVLRDGRLTILCEYLDLRHGRGVITALSDPDSARLTLVSIGPEPPVHLSFPFLFETDGQVYCVPECHEAGEVALYAADSFPDRWVKVATLLEHTAVVDPTVFRHGGYWWLAAAGLGMRSPSADLYLWYSRSVLGPWQPHPGNPVKTDVRSTRPAGTPFTVDGILYRPTMDCTETYGGRVIVNRVLTLTPIAFREEVAATVEPDARGPYPDGLHTLSAVGDLTLIDGKRLVFIPAEFRKLASGMLTSLWKAAAKHLRPGS
jgi:hypothetical protein